MIKWFRKRSFRGKLLAVNSFLITTAVVISLVFYIYGVKVNMDNNLSYFTQFNEQMNMILDMAIDAGTIPNMIHFVDKDIEVILRQKMSEKSVAQRYEAEKKMANYLQMITLLRNNTLRTTIVTKNGDVYSSYQGETDEYLEYMDKECEKLTWENKSKPFYTQIHSENINNVPQLLLTAVYQLYQVGNTDGLGVLYLDMDFSEITRILNRQVKGSENLTALAIVAGDEIIYNSSKAFVNLAVDLDEGERTELLAQITKTEGNSLERNVRIKGVPCVVLIAQNENTGWYILQYLPENSLILYSMEGMIGIAIGMGILLIVDIVFSFFLSDYVSRPIKGLSQAMAKAKVGKVQPYESESALWEDEIGNLVRSYNDMGERINDSINRIYIHKLNQKQAELKMLQFQINPHFLYNALYTISSIAKLEEIDPIAEIAESLSDLFRYNIKGKELVTLGQELVQVQNYIRIQSIRFPERFCITYQIEDNVKDTVTLKFILQPIVENAMCHAFVRNRPQDKINIEAYLKDEKILVIKICDDGIGISPEKLEKLNHRLESTEEDSALSDQEEGIGLLNVNARLKNYYGEQYGIKITSVQGEFTCVELRMEARWDIDGEEIL